VHFHNFNDLLADLLTRFSCSIGWQWKTCAASIGHFLILFSVRKSNFLSRLSNDHLHKTIYTADRKARRYQTVIGFLALVSSGALFMVVAPAVPNELPKKTKSAD
jgi:hypothetical protein